MAEVRQLYKCKTCGSIVEITHKGEGTLVCCEEPMNLVVENSVEAAVEKHVPVIEKVEGGVLVKIGEVEHPMVPEHHIEWIEVHTEDKVYRKYLKVGEKPEAVFKIDEKVLYAREYCNLHGLWKNNVK